MIRLYGLSAAFTASPLLTQVAGGDGGLGLDTVVQTGVTGSLAVALLVFARTAYLRETTRADRLEEQLRELNRTVLDRYATALADAAHAVAEAQTALTKGR